jgi:hypothetical protein
VPADSLSVGASELLPAGVTIGGGGTTFVVTTPTANINTTLAAVCGLPICQSGVTVSAPVPAFTSAPGALSTTIAFPSGVSTATVSGGSIAVAVTNNLGFDPLRPNGPSTAPFGRLIVAITSGAVTRTDTILGSATQGMPNAATTNLLVALPTGTYASSISVALSLVVPAGATASLNGSNAFAVSAGLQNFAVSQASVVVNSVAISTTPTNYDLDGADFADQVEGGAMLLDITNPFTATGALSVVLSAPAQGGAGPVSISKAVSIPALPTSAATVTLTKAELQSLLGKNGVTISTTGTVNGTGAGNTVTVTPTSEIKVRTRVQLILNVGA